MGKQYSEVICDTIIEDWSFIDPKVKNRGKILRNKRGRPIARKGGWCKVYKCEIEGKEKALRLWISDMEMLEMHKRSDAISKFIKNNPSKYFINFEYIAEGYEFNGNIYPIIIMDWCKGRPLKEFITDCIEDGNEKEILEVARKFLELTVELEKMGISHGDLQHDNIIITESGELKLVDYDSMYVPELQGCKDIILGLEGYQHPLRLQNEILQPYIDRFSELMIFLTLYLIGHKPELWNPEDMYDPMKTNLFLFKLQSVPDEVKQAIDEDSIKGLRSLYFSLKSTLMVNQLSRVSTLKSIVDAANIYPRTSSTSTVQPSIKRPVRAAKIPDNLKF